MIHVVFIVSRISKGGPINQLFYLCKYLDQRSIRFTLITTSPPTTSNTYHDELRALGIEIIELDYGKVESLFKGKKTIQHIVDHRSVHIVQSFGFRSEFMVSRLRRVATITTVRNRPLFNYRIIYGYFLGTILCFLHMQFVKQFDTVIACSKTVSKNILPFGITSQVITNAFDDSIIPDTVKAKSKGDLRKELNIPKGGKVFITISSNLPGKNIPFIIDAFCKSGGLQGDILLVAGFVRASILDRYRGVSKIRFLGRVKNIFEYYKASDFFISASRSEGMPNGVLEVMAMGVPVILSDIEAHKEIARSVDYPIGAVFRNHDAGDFIRSIMEVKTADWEGLSRNCVNCIKTCFDGSRMSKDYQKLYRSLYHSIADNYGTKCV